LCLFLRLTFEAIPKIDLFTALQTLITTYPLEGPLRGTLLDHLYELLRQKLPDDPGAIKLFATRRLGLGLDGEALIDALKSANEVLLGAIGSAGVDQVYAEFVEEWARMDLEGNLVGTFIFQVRS
jgi:U3 small nucleolar RNA-associated protein 6